MMTDKACVAVVSMLLSAIVYYLFVMGIFCTRYFLRLFISHISYLLVWWGQGVNWRATE